MGSPYAYCYLLTYCNAVHLHGYYYSLTYCNARCLSCLQDLLHFPGNGWSRLGLWQVAKAAGKAEHELEHAKQQWQQAWADADVQIGSSCPALAQPFKS